MVDPCLAASKASEPCPSAQPRHVPGPVSDRVLPGEKALHHLLPRLHHCRRPSLLLRTWKLPLLEYEL